MKIKSIKPTNKFAEIKFREILDDPINKRVYTPSGFQPVLACGFIKCGPTLKIKTAAGELICDPQHKVRVCRSGKVTSLSANELNQETDFLEGYNNRPLTFEVEPGPIENLYDVELPDPHWWYTSGLVSHNSLFLCNNAINSVKQGLDTLLVTFEMPEVKVALRCLGALSDEPLNQHRMKRDKILKVARSTFETHKAHLVIVEMPPDDCSVNNVSAVINQFKRSRGWAPKVICLDYLELMMSRKAEYNGDDYTRQKHVATEVCGLAKKENALIYTATQTNRSGSGAQGRAASFENNIDLNQAAESYGKMMPVDYVASLNQNETEHASNPPRMRIFWAKNRNGPKHSTVEMTINYTNMQVRQNV